MESFELELKNDFLEEATQFLVEAEKYYLILEDNPNDSKIINDIFRLVHNIKGSSRAVGFDELGAFTHEFEHFLTEIKNLNIMVNSEIVNLLLRCNDHVVQFVQLLKSDIEGKLDSSSLISEIHQMMGRGTLGLTTTSTGTSASESESVSVSTEEVEGSGESPQESFYEVATSAGVSELESTSDLDSDSSEDEISSAEVNKVLPFYKEENIYKEENRSSGEQNSSVALQTASGSDESIRINLSRLDKLINYVGELVVLQAVLKEQSGHQNTAPLKKTIQQVGKATKEIQEISMGLRMLPLKQTFQKMQRIVRDTSTVLDKKVHLILQGEDVEVDKTLLENLNDPLVHIVRNSVDHGIESREERLASGKSENGEIILRAYHQSSKLIIEIIDDGAGIHAEKLFRKAIEKGIVKADANLSQKDKINLIFHPGFSMKKVATEVSGRGVGMDVVKTNIEKIQGEVLVETEVGKGTKIQIILPLTLAIIDGMVLKSGSERFVVPLSHVFETVRPKKDDVKKSSGLGNVLLLKGETIPLYFLSSLTGKPLKDGLDVNDFIAIIIRDQQEAYAVLIE